MQKRISQSEYYFLLATVVCSLVWSFCVPIFGQGTAGGAKPATSGQHSEVQLSEQLSIEDKVSAKLTPGQKRALASAKALGPDSAVVFKSDGKVVKKGPAGEFDKTFKACKNLQPISDRCWLCKDDGTILCSTSKKLKPESSELHVHTDSK